MFRYRKQFTLLVLVSVLILVASCGSSSSSAPATSMTGSVFASSVSGASVSVKNGSGVQQSAISTTGQDGAFSVAIPDASFASDLRFIAAGGTFTDEVTGVTTTAGTLSAYISGGSLTSGTSVNLTPSSTIVHDLIVNHSKTMDEAQSIFTAGFGYGVNTSIVPKNAATNGSDAAERLEGFRAGLFSQLTKDLGLAPEQQFDLLSALSEDLADGALEGRNGTSVVSIGTATTMPQDIQNRFERSLVSYLSNTSCNLTGLTADQIGSLPFAKIALTSMYRIEYVPGMMAAAQGKTSFKLKITKLSDGSAVPGLALSLMPAMHMASMSHSTPVDSITDNGDGTYSGTIYYLMASMMNGMSAGYWDLRVSTGGMGAESVTFYPSVGMAMGSDTVRATLKGQSDTISSMAGTEKRSWYLFKDSLVSGATATFNLFIAAKQGMMSYPAVSVGTVLSSPTGTVNTMSIEASTDGGATWTAATDNTKGHWSVGGLAGLVSGQTGTIYVKLTVNGEVKTTDGNTDTGSNGYASFSVKP